MGVLESLQAAMIKAAADSDIALKAAIDAKSASRNAELSKRILPIQARTLIDDELMKRTQKENTESTQAKPQSAMEQILPDPASIGGGDNGQRSSILGMDRTAQSGALDPKGVTTTTPSPGTTVASTTSAPRAAAIEASARKMAAGNSNLQVDTESSVSTVRGIFGQRMRSTTTHRIITKDVSMTPAQTKAYELDKARTKATVFSSYAAAVPIDQVPKFARAAEYFSEHNEVPEEMVRGLTTFAQREADRADTQVDLQREGIDIQKRLARVQERSIGLREAESVRDFGQRRQEFNVGVIFKDEAAQREQVKISMLDRELRHGIRTDNANLLISERVAEAGIAQTHAQTESIIDGIKQGWYGLAQGDQKISLARTDLDSTIEHRDKAADLAERGFKHGKTMDKLNYGLNKDQYKLAELNSNREWKKARFYMDMEKKGMRLKEQDLEFMMDMTQNRFNWEKHKFENLSAGEQARMERMVAEFGLSVAQSEQHIVNINREFERNVGKDSIDKLFGIANIDIADRRVAVEEGMLSLRRRAQVVSELEFMRENQANPEDYTISMAMGYDADSYGEDGQARIQDDLRNFAGGLGLDDRSEAEVAALGSRVGQFMDGVLTVEKGSTWMGISYNTEMPSIMAKDEFITSMAIALGDVEASPKVRTEAIEKLTKAGVMAESTLNGVQPVTESKFRSYSRRLMGGYNTLRGSVVWEKALKEGGFDPAEMGPAGVEMSDAQARRMIQEMLGVPEIKAAMESGRGN